MSNPGPRGLSQVLYAFSSTVGNNGSAFAGLNGNTLFYNVALGITMLFGRFWMCTADCGRSPAPWPARRSYPPARGHCPRTPSCSWCSWPGRSSSWGRSRSSRRCRSDPSSNISICWPRSEVAHHDNRRQSPPTVRSGHPVAGRAGFFPEAHPAAPGPEPGDVRGVRGIRPDNGALRASARQQGRGVGGVHPGRIALALVHRALRELRRGNGRGPGKGPGGLPSEGPPRHSGQTPPPAGAHRGIHAVPGTACGRAMSCWSRRGISSRPTAR